MVGVGRSALSRFGVVSALLFAVAVGAGHDAAAGDTRELPQACRTDCATPYGRTLGIGAGEVPAYSNCNSGCVVLEPNRQEGTYTGIKWQCVEYARRWLLVNKGVVYGDVDYASDIWSGIDHFTRVADGTAIPVKAYENGSASPPQVGDLLIYAKALFGTGHVAVVTRADDGRLEIAEQNFRNQAWPGHYARQVELIEKDGRYWLLDPYLIGWKRMAD